MGNVGKTMHLGFNQLLAQRGNISRTLNDRDQNVMQGIMTNGTMGNIDSTANSANPDIQGRNKPRKLIDRDPNEINAHIHKPKTLIDRDPNEMNGLTTNSSKGKSKSTPIFDNSNTASSTESKNNTTTSNSSPKIIEGIDKMSDDEVIFAFFDRDKNGTLDPHEKSRIGTSKDMYSGDDDNFINFLRENGNKTYEEFSKENMLDNAKLELFPHGSNTAENQEYAQVLHKVLDNSIIHDLTKTNHSISQDITKEEFADIDGDGTLNDKEKGYANDLKLWYSGNDSDVNNIINLDWTLEEAKQMEKIYTDQYKMDYKQYIEKDNQIYKDDFESAVDNKRIFSTIVKILEEKAKVQA